MQFWKAQSVAKSLEMHIGSGESQTEFAAISDVQDKQLNATAETDTAGNAQHQMENNLLDLCPSCGSASLINIEGCKQCNHCGYSRCN